MGSTRSTWRNNILSFYDGTTHERTAPFAPVVFTEEFLGTTLVAGATLWLAKDIHAEATEANIADQHGGVFGIGVGATDAEQEAGLTMNDQLNFNIDKGFIAEFVVAAHTIPTGLLEAYFGMANNYVKGRIAAADEGPTVHSFFKINATGTVSVYYDDTVHDGTFATGVTALVADAYHVFRMDFTTSSAVLYYIDGVQVGTSYDMSQGTNVVLQPYFMCYKDSSTGVGDLYIDTVRVWSPR